MAKEKDWTAWFADARFGVFIHWGMYSLIGRGEQVLFRERLNPAEYAGLADRFRPRHFDADRWARLAREAGAKYMILTTKHHDGFCLFHSDVSDFTSTRTAAGRDFVAEYASACRAHGLKVGLYYSLADWMWPAYFSGPAKDPNGFADLVRYTHAQVRELCTNYGRIDVLWFDGGWPHSAADWQSEKLARTVRKLQPTIMMNDRLHGGGIGNVQPVGTASMRRRGYFDTYEQRDVLPAVGRPTETERTTCGRWWGYCRGDRQWRSPREIIDMLSQAAHDRTNLVVNVGPKPDGTFPAPFKRILREAGRWLAVNGEAIYGSSRGILDVSTIGRTTVKGNALYLHAFCWPGTSAIIYGLDSRVLKAEILGSRQKVQVEQKGLHVALRGLPARRPDPVCTVVKLTVKGGPREHPSVVPLWAEGRDTGPLAGWSEGICSPRGLLS